MGQKWLPFLTHKLGGSWGAWEGSREHLEGFGGSGRASEKPTKLGKPGEVLNSQKYFQRNHKNPKKIQKIKSDEI